MKKIIILLLILISLASLSACSLSSSVKNTDVNNQGHTISDTAVGINKGNLPPDFSITTTDGKNLNLREFKDKNKPILIYFWASWCPYCSRDFDTVKNIYPKYADGVAFLAIDLDLNENAELINNYKNKKGLAGVDFAEGKESILSDYGITHTTTKYAIGKDGAILYKGSGVFTEQQWETLLSGLANS